MTFSNTLGFDFIGSDVKPGISVSTTQQDPAVTVFTGIGIEDLEIDYNGHGWTDVIDDFHPSATVFHFGVDTSGSPTLDWESTGTSLSIRQKSIPSNIMEWTKLQEDVQLTGITGAESDTSRENYSVTRTAVAVATPSDADLSNVVWKFVTTMSSTEITEFAGTTIANMTYSFDADSWIGPSITFTVGAGTSGVSDGFTITASLPDGNSVSTEFHYSGPMR